VGGGGSDERTTIAEPTVASTATATAPAPLPGPPSPFAIGQVLPAEVGGWQIVGTDPVAVNVEVEPGSLVETAQARRGADVALLVGLRPAGGEDARIVVERLRADLGGIGEGGVPLGGTAVDGVVQRVGDAFLVTLAVPDRAVVTIAERREVAVELAAAVSEAL
jgi:hypothetical protein